jgi:hypothetical protein
MRAMRPTNFGDGGDHFSGYAHAVAGVVSGEVVADDAEKWSQCAGSAARARSEALPDRLDVAAQTAGRHGAAPGRDLLTGTIEMEEAYLGGPEEGAPGRGTQRKALIGVAAQEDGRGIGRIRLQRLADASGQSLEGFIRASVAPGSVLHADGWSGYAGVTKLGYGHEVTVVKGKPADELLPRTHRAISLLKRWLLGTRQGAVGHKHLDYYLDEFAFRFNRRTSTSRGKLFSRLAQQALLVEPRTYRMIGDQIAPAAPKHKGLGLPE